MNLIMYLSIDLTPIVFFSTCSNFLVECTLLLIALPHNHINILFDVSSYPSIRNKMHWEKLRTSPWGISLLLVERQNAAAASHSFTPTNSPMRSVPLDFYPSLYLVCLECKGLASRWPHSTAASFLPTIADVACDLARKRDWVSSKDQCGSWFNMLLWTIICNEGFPPALFVLFAI